MYIVCPLVEASSVAAFSEVKAVEVEYERLQVPPAGPRVSCILAAHLFSSEPHGISAPGAYLHALRRMLSAG